MSGKQLEIGQTVQEGRDTNNNIWYIDGNTIYLKLISESYPRKLGVLFDKRFIVYRDREKHLFKKTDSYGFNNEVVRALPIDVIDIYEGSRMYRVTKEELLSEGNYLNFKESGFEQQIFLPIRFIEERELLLDDDRKRIELIGKEWYDVLVEEFKKPYMINLGRFLANRRKVARVYPESEDMFKALKLTRFKDVKVVIIGQNPYHTGVADGLAFSSKDDTIIPPSLQMIYKEMEKELFVGLHLDQNPSLEYLASQGVLLLNRSLTVEKGNPNSHTEIGWKNFTDKILSLLREHPRNLVFLLWGSSARGIRKQVENNRHLILEAEHPAFAARDSRPWENHNCFTKTNDFLNSMGYGQIEW